MEAETSFDNGGDGDEQKDDGRRSLGSNDGQAENDLVGTDIGVVSTVDGRWDLGPNLGIKGRRRRR